MQTNRKIFNFPTWSAVAYGCQEKFNKNKWNIHCFKRSMYMWCEILTDRDVRGEQSNRMKPAAPEKSTDQVGALLACINISSQLQSVSTFNGYCNTAFPTPGYFLRLKYPRGCIMHSSKILYIRIFNFKECVSTSKKSMTRIKAKQREAKSLASTECHDR